MKIGSTTRTQQAEPVSRVAWSARLLVVAAVALMALPAPVISIPVAHAAAATVTTCSGDQTVSGSLPNLVFAASSGDTINFSVDCPSASPIQLGVSLTISGKTLTVDGSGHSVAVSGQTARQIFQVQIGSTLTVKNLTLQNGHVDAAAGSGGAINNAGTLSVDRTAFLNNSSGGNGGAIASTGKLTVSNSTFTSNSAGFHGGAIDANNAPSLPASLITGDTFSANSAGNGGAIALGTNNPATVLNSTFVGNSSSTGGNSFYIYTTLSLSFSTLANNNNGTLPSIELDNSLGGGHLTVKGTILSNAKNCSSTATGGNLTPTDVTDGGSNVTFQETGNTCDLTAASDNINADPGLSSLADYGGPTQTLLPAAGGPAINAATSCSDVGSTSVGTDQRGVSRPQGTACDIGSVEAVPTFSAGQDGSFTWGGSSQNPLLITGTSAPNGTLTLRGSGSCSGTPLASTTVDSSGTWAIPVATLSSEGSYSFAATATDAASTSLGCSGPISVNVDRTAAPSTVTTPGLGTSPAYINAATWATGCGSPNVVGICGTATDTGGSGVAAVYVAIEAANGTFWNGTDFNSSGAWLKAAGTSSWRLAVPRPPDGTYTVASAAIDNAGNTPTIFGMSIAGICSSTGTHGQLALNGGQLALNGGLCTVSGTGNSGPVSGQLALNGGQLALNGGQLALNGGQMALNGGQLALNGGTCTLRDNAGNSAQYTVAAVSAGSLFLSSTGGQLALNGGQLALNGGQMALNGGLLTPSSSGQLALNSGQLALNGGNCMVTAGDGSTTGQLALNGGQLALNGGQLALNGGQLALNGGQLALNGGQMALNGGQLALNGGSGGNVGNAVVDTAPPFVSSFEVDAQQGSGAANINPGATFHIHFSESVQSSTISGSTITVTPQTGPALTINPSCDATCLNASFAGFQSATTYTVTVSGVQDLAGNALVGTGTNPATFTFTTAAGPMLTGTAANDSDGDNIPNGWDGTATPTFTQGAQSTNTAALGFSPSHHDLCLVENYMQGKAANNVTYDQHITQAANQAIVNAFANAPVTNPDGTLGIHLVIFEGPNYSAGLPAGYSGPSFGGPIDMIDPLGDASTGAFDWSAPTGTPQSFDGIRTAKFVPTGLPQFCHYAVIAHTLKGTGSSGASRGIGASDLVVALGGTVKGQGVGTQSEQQGTVMHELGHNLGLYHGGGPGISDLEINYKPNYMSVMNYFYQFEGLPGGGVLSGLDFSRGTMPPLNEGGLNDSVGLNPGASLSGGVVFGTRFFCGGTATPNVVADASQPINWGCASSGPLLGGATHFADINGDGSLPTAPFEVLHDYNDWANVNFIAGDIGLGSVPPPPTTTTIDISSGASGGGPNSAPAVESKSVAPFTWAGFFSPLSANSQGKVANTGKAGRTYPVKFQLKDATGKYVSTLSAVRSITYSKSTACTGGSTDPIDFATTSTSGLHYDATANQYVYNWATPTVGCYMLNVNLSDGTTYLSLFSLS